jgi:hypothetical protein
VKEILEIWDLGKFFLTICSAWGNKALPIVKKLNEQIKEGYSEREIESFKKVLIGAFNKF